MRGAAAAGKTLYIVSGYSSLPLATIAAAAAEDQVLWSQIYFSNNVTANNALIDASVAAGVKALVWSVDSPGSPSRARAARYDVGSAYVFLLLPSFRPSFPPPTLLPPCSMPPRPGPTDPPAA